jgi:hypothetical protein
VATLDGRDNTSGYRTGHDLPLTYAPADTFPVGDRWLCSALAQIDLRRRLIVVNFGGMTDEVGTGSARINALATALLGIAAANGTISRRSWNPRLGRWCRTRALASRGARVWAISIGYIVVLLVVS